MAGSYLAIDIGASSGRHILGSVQEGRLVLEEVYRFDNRQVRKNGHDCWDMDNLWNGILGGLKACGERGTIPTVIGIDTWAVDYVLLDKDDQLLGDAVAYRDSRTEGMDALVDANIPPEELYARTGIQKQIFNTIYQLMALKEEHPEQLEQAESLLMIPDYFNFLLTGVKKQEYTNATSTNLVNAREKTWDLELIARLGLPTRLFGELSVPGTVVGELLPEIQAQVGFNATVILPATHDTGSAFLAVPAKDDNAVYLSSGTWSLLGVENGQPITTEASRAQNFTNEGGA
ncbi:MAG: rhamnulokinase, partial [Clostridiales bacterium]|nr:rhamnulokinase [Clostridiales bacterium]